MRAASLGVPVLATSSLFAFAAWFSLGCTAGDPVAPSEVPAPPPPAPVAELPAATVDKVLAPSPLSLEKEVREAGLGEGLADLVPSRPFATDIEDKDRVALRTGAVLAYTVLAGRTSPKPDFLSQLRLIRGGLHTLGTGKGLLASLDGFVVHIENDTASRDDFLQELDAVASTMVPEQGWGEGDRTGPLLQAGAWLAGTNLVAQSIVRADKAEAADKLLRRAYVADYFLSYLDGEGAEKSGLTASALADTLRRLSSIANQPVIGVADARSVAEVTQAMLTQL